MQIEKLESLVTQVSQAYDTIGDLTIGDISSDRKQAIKVLETLSKGFGACKDKIDFILRIFDMFEEE